jgi:cyclophilin family peptidyl-prolyl cis-trans isomerase
MKYRNILFIFLVIVFALTACSGNNDDDNQNNNNNPPEDTYETIKIQTSKGDIFLWLYDETPKHKENFIKLTNDGLFDSVIFHRVIKNFMIQTGDLSGKINGGIGYTIPAEFNSKLKHMKGTVGAARLGNIVNPEKESSGSQFYICHNDSGCSHLDMEYTVFGITIDGFDVVDAIAKVPTKNDKPIDDVYMLKVTVEKFTEKELKDQFGFELPE